MRKFLKQLRKGLRAACVTAALATCWNVGQSVAQAGYRNGDEVAVQFTGTISPTVSDLSHVYLIYGTGYSGTVFSNFNVMGLGDFSGGNAGSFSVYGDAVYDEQILWFAAGLYGDLSSGQYTEGTNGVSLSASYYPGYSDFDSWDDFINVSEGIMFNYLLNNDISGLSTIKYNDVHGYLYFDSDSDQRNMYNFSEVYENGTVAINFEIVPEPLTILLLGSGGIIVLGRKRRKE
jgi:hypothetical protein